jgi:hypothetical protein
MQMFYYTKPATAEILQIGENPVGSAMNFYKTPASLFYGV